MFGSSHISATEKLIRTALVMSLIIISTVIVRIPVPMTQGYVHLGDAVIYIGVILLGRHYGSVAAGFGSAMADVLGGFAFWAPWTFIIKFAMAFVTGTLLIRLQDRRGGELAAMSAGGVIMCAGYLIAERLMYGTWAAALIGLPWNIGQFCIGSVIALIVQHRLSGR